jgi:hypothetical protein
MITLTVDEKTLALLRQADELAEIRDASGAVVGFFTPVEMEKARQYADLAAKVDPAEIQRRKSAHGPKHSTEQVIDHLNSLERP